MMNKAKFCAHMVANNDTQKTLADALGISLSRLNAKINETGGAEFKQNEIAYIRERYSLQPTETDAIFFAPKLSQKDNFEREARAREGGKGKRPRRGRPGAGVRKR